jgi:small subunit ribosomal protein S17
MNEQPTAEENVAATEKIRAPAPAETAQPAAAEDRTRRKIRVGVVVSDTMDKTVLVRIDRRVRHPLYKKTVARSNKLAAHDQTNDAHVGDTVRIMETRRLSKSKRWRVVEIVERAK